MRVLLTSHAAVDIEEACGYYLGIEAPLGTRFADDVGAAIERIVMFPHGAPPVEGFPALRRARLRRFPYGLFYQLTPAGDLLVVRVLHSRRQHPDALTGDLDQRNG